MMELMLTIDPPPVLAICSAASLVPRKTLVWLTAMIRSQPSSPSASPTELPEIPALLTRMSSRPWVDSVRSISVRHAASLVTSAAAAIAWPPPVRMSAASASASIARMSATTTRAPSLANNRASASPMPCAPPVMIATLSFRRISFLVREGSSPCCRYSGSRSFGQAGRVARILSRSSGATTPSSSKLPGAGSFGPSRSRLRLALDDHASVNQSLSRLLGQVQSESRPLVRDHLRQAVRHRSGDVDLLTILPFSRLATRQPSQCRVGVGRVMPDIGRVHRRLRRRGHEDFRRFVPVPPGAIEEAFRNLGIRLVLAVLDDAAEFLVPCLPPTECDLIDAECPGRAPPSAPVPGRSPRRPPAAAASPEPRGPPQTRPAPPASSLRAGGRWCPLH